MYGTSEKSEGSWKEALEVTELPPERYLLSGVHCLPSLSLPPPSPNPHPNIKESPPPLSGGTAFKKTGKHNTNQRHTWMYMVENEWKSVKEDHTRWGVQEKIMGVM